MDEYKQKLIEAEEQSQELLAALESLKSNADEFASAKLDLNNASKSFDGLIQVSKENVEGIVKLNEYAKEVNVPALMEYVSSVQNEQKTLQVEIQAQLGALENKLDSIDDLKNEVKQQFESISFSTVQIIKELKHLKEINNNIISTTKTIKVICVVMLLSVIGLSVFLMV
jgi:uncharacterized membrane-anchored protein